FQNQGNDNATNFTITDILPINTKFNYPGDIISLPADIVISGVTYKVTHTYNAATRTITFTIPKQFVEVSDPRYTIRFKVKVVESCSEISDVCSNIVMNTALSNYSGTYNTGTFGDKSLASYTSCNIGIPQSTNFLVDVDDCKFEKNEILCGTSIQIKAANGYASYSWSTSPTGTPVIGTGQTLTVVKEGVYYVKNTAPAPCLSIEEKFTVSLANGLLENPVLPYARAPYAGSITQCPDGGKLLPNLFLCGASDFRDIKTGISATGTTITWEKLDEASCTAVANDKCANENQSCTWLPVATGPDYRADTKGQYRLTVKYQNNCVNQFYFNVYKNELNPTITYNDIYCNTKGRITVNGVPAGYEYSLTKTGTYQDSNVFSPINTAGNYTVYIKQKNVTTNPCIFEVSVNIVDRKLDVQTIVTHPICYGDKGSIKVNTSGVRGQYYYELFKDGNSVQKVGPIVSGDHLFNNLDSGGYSFTVRTDDGCTYTNYYVGINTSANEIKATASIIKPLTDCGPGKILITTDPDWKTYSYFVNGSTTFQNSKEIDAPTAGLYTIRVVEGNCEKTVTINVPKTPKPTYDVIAPTSINCYGDPAEIRINLTSPTTGYTMGYSINNGGTYQTSPIFTNLTPGTYNVKVKYSVTYPVTYYPYTETQECSDPAQQVIITGPTSSVTAS
ncbi:MAG TPA: chromophore lyase, partial [Flavobacterium sp.]